IKEHNFDLVASEIPRRLKNLGCGPIFLNWQGYLAKEELEASFDGKLFHRYGVKWQTLRLRIQKFEKAQKLKKTTPELQPLRPLVAPVESKHIASRPQRCDEVLRIMASNAAGSHREKIEFYAN